VVAFLRKLHKWVGLLIGLQVLLWLLSGLALSLIDPVKASGEKWARTASHPADAIQSATLLEPGELTAEQLDKALSISLGIRQGQPVYRVRRANSTTLINATDGSTVITTKDEARRLAEQDFTGIGKVISIENGMAPDLETRDSTGEYWRVNFSDSTNTSIYISVSTGEILERRNSYWRVFDFFWMLHIMDYAGHENINNSLIIIVALIAIWLGISGFILLFYSFNRRDFNLPYIRAAGPGVNRR
jgi:uncharacterized iron-regulated membrane protein